MNDFIPGLFIGLIFGGLMGAGFSAAVVSPDHSNSPQYSDYNTQVQECTKFCGSSLASYFPAGKLCQCGNTRLEK